MKLRNLILFLCLIISHTVSSQEKYPITWDYRGLDFNEFVSRSEKLYPVRFFYNEEWTKDFRLADYKGNLTLTDILDSLFRGTTVYYFTNDDGNIVLTKDFIVRISEKTDNKKQKYIPTIDYSEYTATNKPAENLIIDIGNPADKNLAGNVVISGYITNIDTKEPVAGATVYIKELSTGGLSNEYGFYKMNLPRGRHLVKFSFIGMKEKAININLFGTGDLNVEMKSVLIPLKETIVSAQKSMTLQRFEVGMEKISISSFKLMPTSMGEVDIIKSVLLIPGVQSVGEGSSGFNVRGGSADQNLILLYGAPVYNSSHFFGFFSAVNSDIIKDMTLYKGGIPGRYGGRISSVMDILPRDGNRREFVGNAGISPITTHIVFEGPIKKDTGSFILAGRTTYSNWVLGLIDNAALKNSKAGFYDVNGRIVYDLNKNNKIDFSAYISHDAFRFNSDTVYQYDNNIMALKWRHFFSRSFFSNISLNSSNYKYDISSKSKPLEAFGMSHIINSTGFKADFNLYLGSRNELNFGSDLIRYEVLPGRINPANDSSIVKPLLIEREKAFEPALYLEDKLTVTDYLSINGGIRYSSFFALGPQTVYLYSPDFPRDQSTITDTVSYIRDKVYKTYSGPEFRFSLNFKVAAYSSLKFNYNRTRQYLHLLSNTTSISPSDTWKLSDYYFKPQVGDQYAIGFYKIFAKRGIEGSAEIYYKEIENMIDFKGGTNLVMNTNIESDMVNVRGKAYGLEMMIKKTEGRVRWSLSYTYSRTLIRSTSKKFSDEIINSGRWFPANFDKPHDLIATFNYLFSRRFSFSANYTYTTGRPITYPVTSFRLGGIILTDYSDRNKYRIPDYSRLDISAKVSGNLKSKKIAHPNWIFSVYNLLGRQNVYSVYFMNEDNMVKGYRLSVFARAIPSVTFNFDF